VMPCSEDGGNVGILLQHYTMSQPRRHWFESLFSILLLEIAMKHLLLKLFKMVLKNCNQFIDWCCGLLLMFMPWNFLFPAAPTLSFTYPCCLDFIDLVIFIKQSVSLLFVMKVHNLSYNSSERFASPSCTSYIKLKSCTKAF
jgi:hypothetical protein